MSSTQIAGPTGIPARTIRDRLRARGVPMRTRGRFDREDRVTVSGDGLADMDVKAGLSADGTGKLPGSARPEASPRPCADGAKARLYRPSLLSGSSAARAAVEQETIQGLRR